MIKTILGAVTAAALTLPAQAQGVFQTPIPAMCSYSFSDIQDQYGGDLELMHSPIENNGGVYLAVFENDTYQVAMLLGVSGVVCVVWDNEIGGDPA
jgi:hypothetical protein